MVLVIARRIHIAEVEGVAARRKLMLIEICDRLPDTLRVIGHAPATYTEVDALGQQLRLLKQIR